MVRWMFHWSEVYSTFLLSKKTVDLDLVGTDISFDSINHAKKRKIRSPSE